MAAVIAEIEPASYAYHDMVGFYALQFNGTMENSGDRIQAMANASGIPIFVADMLQQHLSTVIIDQAIKRSITTRENNDPGKYFHDACRRYAEPVLQALQDYKYRIGIGHSLGGTVVAGMQVYGEEGPFNGGELADTFNVGDLKRREFLRYTALDELHRRRVNFPEIPRSDWSKYALQYENRMIDRMNNLKELMEGTESVEVVEAVAAMTDLPLHIIGFKHGLSGRGPVVASFLDKLVAVRQASGENPAPLMTTFEDRWHSDLQRADVVVPYLARTIKLVREYHGEKN